MEPKVRIVINTLAQYAKTIISGLITLYSSRIILKNLGVDDFGIYSLIAGIVMMLSFLTNALSSTTQRYISFYQGKGNHGEIVSYFCNSVFMHICLGGILLVVFFVMTPLISCSLNISPERINAAVSVYYAVILTLFVAFITSPFRAVLISHENIVYISIIDVIDVVLKLLIALSLSTIVFDKLIYYGWMLLIIQVFNLIAFTWYSFSKYKECILPQIRFYDRTKMKRLLCFAGWNVYGLACTIGRTQGISVVLNLFVGTVANAAYGLGLQLSSYVNYMSESLLNAMRPQIMKSEGNDERRHMLLLSGQASKYSFFLLSLLSLPCIFEMPLLLRLWLGNYPDYSVLFARMFLISGIVDSLSIGLHIANQATGNLKKFSLIINSLKLLTLPLVVVLLFFTRLVITVAVFYVLIEFAAAMLRLIVLKSDGLNIKNYIQNVLFRCFIPIILYLIFCSFIAMLDDEISRFTIMYSVAPALYLFFIYYYGLETEERSNIKLMMAGFLKKIRYRS